MAQLNFNATGVPIAMALDPIPTGWYPGVIVESEMTPTQDGQGAFLKLVEEIIDGPYKGRKVFDRLNLYNSNPTAVEIATKTLSAICHATGVIQVADSAMLHNIPLAIKVNMVPARLDKNTGQAYEAGNDVRGYKNINELTAAQPQWQQPVVAAQPAWQQPVVAAQPAWQQPVAPAGANVPTQPVPGAPAAPPPWAVKR